MNWIKLACQQLVLGLAFALTLTSNTWCLAQVKAQPAKSIISSIQFKPPKPPNRGSPAGRQRGGASRGGDCPATDKLLTALVPVSKVNSSQEEAVWGLTVAESPTFWFYVPYSLTPKQSVEFVLKDDQAREIYKTTFSASQTQAGVVQFRLPPTVGSLEIGKMYYWDFSIYCNPEEFTFVSGWVQRIALEPELKSRLEQSKPQERLALYAENGLWYDAVTALAELRLEAPQNTTLMADWTSLLQFAGLDDIAPEPINGILKTSEAQ